MDYQLELGAWNSVFAVPSAIVDRHLKLAGGAQLKVILWLLRHAGETVTADDLGKALNMHPADVRDSMTYWIEAGLIRAQDGLLAPQADIPEIKTEEAAKADTALKSAETASVEDDNVATEQETASVTKPSRALSRPEKPDSIYLARRMEEDAGIAYLMQTADEIFGRLTSVNDKATLLMIHETDGLPVEVIIMLMQYAAGIGKCNIRYIEKTAISWADEEINTLELAEKKIQNLTSGRSAAVIVQKLFGLDEHSPTEKETAYADRWMNQWKFSTDMLRRAYEICVDAKNKYIPKYVDSVLSRWNSAGIKTPEQIEIDSSRKKAPKMSYEPTYDISEYESMSVIDKGV